jgi:hypothetical protein
MPLMTKKRAPEPAPAPAAKKAKKLELVVADSTIPPPEDEWE